MRYSLVLPFHNEKSCVGSVLPEAAAVMDSMPGAGEIIAIDDGSTDETWEVLQGLTCEIPCLRAFRASERGGQSSAIFFGMRQSRGEIVMTMDGDGQNDPGDLPAMVELLAKADMVIGVRLKRRDRWVKRIASKIANAGRRRVIGDRFRDVGCAVRVMKREVAENLPYFTSLHRFAPILAESMGFTVVETVVGHRPRMGDRTKYGTWDRLVVGLADLRGVRWLKRRIRRYRLVSAEDGGP